MQTAKTVLVLQYDVYYPGGGTLDLYTAFQANDLDEIAQTVTRLREEDPENFDSEYIEVVVIDGTEESAYKSYYLTKPGHLEFSYERQFGAIGWPDRSSWPYIEESNE